MSGKPIDGVTALTTDELVAMAIEQGKKLQWPAVMDTLQQIESLTAAQQQGQAVAWMRRNVRYKEADGRSEGERIVSERQVYPDDIPLYTAPPPSVPDGWALVPKHPTVPMIEAFEAVAQARGNKMKAHEALSAMLAAAPALAQQPAAVDSEPDCPHSALDGCDCYATQHQAGLADKPCPYREPKS